MVNDAKIKKSFAYRQTTKNKIVDLLNLQRNIYKILIKAEIANLILQPNVRKCNHLERIWPKEGGRPQLVIHPLIHWTKFGEN